MPRIALGLVPLFLAAAGCGNSVPPETTPAKGRDALKAALDAWVNGSSPAGLKPVVVADPDWEEGHKLVKYEIDPADARSGVDLVLRVRLVLQRRDGKAQEKTVNFVVGTGPPTVVLRYQ